MVHFSPLTTDDVATILLHFSVFGFHKRISKPQICPFLDIVIPLFLLPSPPCFSLFPKKLSSTCIRILRGDHTIWVSSSSPCLGARHETQFASQSLLWTSEFITWSLLEISTPLIASHLKTLDYQQKLVSSHPQMQTLPSLSFSAITHDSLYEDVADILAYLL